LVYGHKRLAFHCLDTGYGCNSDDMSLYIEQCNIKKVANVVVGWIAQWWALLGGHHHMLH